MQEPLNNHIYSINVVKGTVRILLSFLASLYFFSIGKSVSSSLCFTEIIQIIDNLKSLMNNYLPCINLSSTISNLSNNELLKWRTNGSNEFELENKD